jgi:N6-L-threonylcarbamoyladenine synthase
VKFGTPQLKHPDRKDSKLNDARVAPSVHARGPRAWTPGITRFDFSYSGIKTAVLRYVETHRLKDSIEARRNALANIVKPKLEDYLANTDQQTLDLIASFQRAMVGDLVAKTLAAALYHDVATLFVTGGVAANNELRHTFEKEAAREGLPVYFPSRPLSTDNAAMIAAAAYPKFLARHFAPMDFSAEAGMPLK